MSRKQPLYPHQPRKKPVQYPHIPNRQPGRTPSTGSSQYLGGWKPGDLAIYSDFGLRSLFIVRVLEWPEEKGDRFTEHFGSVSAFGSITHDRAGGSVRAEIVDTSLVDWDFGPRHVYEHRKEGTIHYYNHSNLSRTIDDIIENERRILNPEVLVRILYDLRKHPGWVMLGVYGLRRDTKAYAPMTVADETGWTKMQDLLDALEKLTKYEIDDISRKLWHDLDDFIVFQSGATKKDMINSLVRWFKRVSHKDRITFIKAVQAKLAEKEQLPVRGEVPGTRYIKWADFTSLPNYPLISRAVNHPHDHRRACKPYTKDGYLSVDAIYNMSSWAGWKSSSLDDRERAIARAIHDLPLGALMTLNKGRRMDQPALLPQGLLPIRR